ncbi:hypothetical protein EV561_109112 [Rhizobium sp. BK376]|nr:hypothetical protein EV561_109112 [Rhizobium sp. BK376]
MAVSVSDFQILNLANIASTGRRRRQDCAGNSHFGSDKNNRLQRNLRDNIRVPIEFVAGRVRARTEVRLVWPSDWHNADHVRPFGQPRPRSPGRYGLPQPPCVRQFRPWQPHLWRPDALRPLPRDVSARLFSAALGLRVARLWQRRLQAAPPASPYALAPRLLWQNDGLEEVQLLPGQMRQGGPKDRCF